MENMRGNCDEAEKKLASMYVENFAKYADKGDVDYTQFGPKLG